MQERNKIVLKAWKKIEKDIIKELDILKNRIKNEIYDNKYFSTTFKELLEKENYFNEVDENYIKEHYIQLDDSATREYPVERINKSIREVLYHIFLE